MYSFIYNFIFPDIKSRRELGCGTRSHLHNKMRLLARLGHITAKRNFTVHKLIVLSRNHIKCSYRISRGCFKWLWVSILCLRDRDRTHSKNRQNVRGGRSGSVAVGCCNGCLCPRGINVVVDVGGIMRKQCGPHSCSAAARPRPASRPRRVCRGPMFAHKVSLW